MQGRNIYRDWISCPYLEKIAMTVDKIRTTEGQKKKKNKKIKRKNKRSGFRQDQTRMRKKEGLLKENQSIFHTDEIILITTISKFKRKATGRNLRQLENVGVVRNRHPVERNADCSYKKLCAQHTNKKQVNEKKGLDQPCKRTQMNARSKTY